MLEQEYTPEQYELMGAYDRMVRLARAIGERFTFKNGYGPHFATHPDEFQTFNRQSIEMVRELLELMEGQSHE